jgi:hypothetical protein
MPAAQPHAAQRGDALILAHCAALARLQKPADPAPARLAELVGEELAHVLVHGLTSGPPRQQAA